MRLAIPDLSQTDSHPIIKEGPTALPIARYDRFVVVTDERYVIVYDVVKMEMLWKNLLSNVDLSKDVKMLIRVNEKYVIIIKEDYDRKAIYCYSLQTGEVLWATDPTNSGSLQAIYSLVLEGDTLYGIGEHPGQGFFFVAYDCASGKQKYRVLNDGFNSVPKVRIREEIYGKTIAVEVQDRKDYFIYVIDKTTGAVLKKIMDKGDGSIGEVGGVAITVQEGHPVLFSKIQFKY
jgi:outer membrane protein assembly factor BamB